MKGESRFSSVGDRAGERQGEWRSGGMDDSENRDRVIGMRRPKPTISSRNEYDAYLCQAQEFASRFATCMGVVGVLLTGGVARGYADHFSELDLAVYLTQQRFEEWVDLPGYGPIP